MFEFGMICLVFGILVGGALGMAISMVVNAMVDERDSRRRLGPTDLVRTIKE
jgi:hypothetical protein